MAMDGSVSHGDADTLPPYSFSSDFEEYVLKEQLKWSLYKPNFNDKWVFWSEQDHEIEPSFSLDNCADFNLNVCAIPKVRDNIRRALQKLMQSQRFLFDGCLFQFWAATKTLEGRTLLTTRYEPFAFGVAIDRVFLCNYRMEMCRKYNNCFYADAQSGEEQLGLPGRVFLHQFPESVPKVEYYTTKEYPQRDLALRCEIQTSCAVPVFEHSSQTCVGVLEMVSLWGSYWYGLDENFPDNMNKIFEEFGLRWFNGKQDCMQHGYAYQAREDENVCTGNDIYVLEFFLSTRSKDNENILTTLNFILGTMEKNFKTFRLASGKELGELMSLEVIYFQNDQKIQFVQSIQATRDFSRSSIQSSVQSSPSVANTGQGSHDANMVTSKAKYDLNCDPFSDSDSSSDSDPSFMQSSTRVANTRPRFQDADLVTIKVKYASTERVLKLSLPCRLVELQEEVAIWLAGTYHVGYKDEEDGFVLIACDEDLQAYIDDSISQGNTSPMVLLEPKEPATNFNPNN